MARQWTCQRVAMGEKCGHVNPLRKQLCERCGKRRRATSQPRHRVALLVEYAEWVARFGESCGICGASPSVRRRLDRDHCHATGQPRGLLCARCNRALPSWVTPTWLRLAAAYLEAADTTSEYAEAA